jgi:hypothetical protein
MKMKKKILATVLFGCALSGSAFAEKVTYEKALADAKAYQDSLPHHENAVSGLEPWEAGDATAAANQMGKWVNIGAINYQVAGAVILSPDSIGKKCSKGTIGFVPKVLRQAVRVHNKNGAFVSQEYIYTPDYRSGNKVECR